MQAFEGKTTRLGPRCSQCEGAMEPGYMIDRTDEYGTVTQVEWAQGAPNKRSKWLGGGVYLKGIRRYAVATFRCETCGFLTSYATEPLNDVQT